MGWIISGIVIVVSLLVISGVFANNDVRGDGGRGFLLFLIGLSILIVLVCRVAPNVFDSGEPRIDITTGTHKVAFVYVAGDYVSVGIERENQETKAAQP